MMPWDYYHVGVRMRLVNGQPVAVITVWTHPREFKTRVTWAICRHSRDCRVQGITVNAFQAKRLFLSLSKLIFYPYSSRSFPLHDVWVRLGVRISLSLFLTSALVFNKKILQLRHKHMYVGVTRSTCGPPSNTLPTVSTTVQTPDIWDYNNIRFYYKV